MKPGMEVVKFFAVAVLILLSFVLSIHAQSSDEILENETLENGECGYNATKSEGLKINGTVNPSQTCIWYIIGNTSVIGTKGLLFEKVHLDTSDSVTIHRADANSTLIFGPYNGIVGPVVIAIEEKDFFVKLSTSPKKTGRSFEVLYNDKCLFAIPPDIEVIQSPTYLENSQNVISCRYSYNTNEENSYTFVFQNFSLDSGSNVTVSGAAAAEQNALYTTTPPDIFGGKVTAFTINLNTSSSKNMVTIVRRNVNSLCSRAVFLANILPVIPFQSPSELKSYNDSTIFECRWLFKSNDVGTLGLLVSKLQFKNVFDMLIVTNGPSELSSPIVEATYINQNQTKAKVIRTSGPYMLVIFRSQAFASNLSGNSTFNRQGGYHSGSGSISMQSGEYSVFLLEVAADDKVLLNFSSSEFKNPATVKIFDGFDTTSNLIAQLNGNVWYPVVSSTSKMMVTTSKFDGKFTASFSGIKSGCVHMSTSSNDAYTVSGNCNSSCVWVIPPQSASEGVLLLEFKLLSLDVNDHVDVFRLGNSETPVVRILHDTNYVPQLTFDPEEGFCIKIYRGVCKKKEEDVVLVAQSTYLPGCSKNFSLAPSTEIQLSSPNYPNAYPIFSNCLWNISASGNTSQFHLAFNKLQLAPNHYIHITHKVNGSTETNTFSGDELPNDMLFGNMEIQFNSSNYNASSAQTSLSSGEGFVLNITSLDCGGIMTSKTGQFSTSKGNACNWFIQVPYKEKDGSVNSIKFTVEEKTEINEKNSEFYVYDGPSVRDSLITNHTAWSHNNTVIFVYRRLNATVPSDVYTVNYNTINCNKSMQCLNGICLHPDWRCDGVNDCGDFTDERNCAPTPVPDYVKETNGVSALTFGLVTVLFFGLGVLAAFLIPKAIKRYRNGRYHQFQDYPGAD